MAHKALRLVEITCGVAFNVVMPIANLEVPAEFNKHVNPFPNAILFLTRLYIHSIKVSISRKRYLRSTCRPSPLSKFVVKLHKIYSVRNFVNEGCIQCYRYADTRDDPGFLEKFGAQCVSELGRHLSINATLQKETDVNEYRGNMYNIICI